MSGRSPQKDETPARSSGGAGQVVGGPEEHFTALVADYNELPTYPRRISYKEYHTRLRPASQVVVFNGCPTDPHKPASVPIYQTATFVQPSSTEFGAFDYTRSGNPTRIALEKHAAMLESAHAAFAFNSGMAALNCVTRLLTQGDELIVGADIYGGMHRLVSRVTSLQGVTVAFVDTTDLAKVAAAITPRTRLVHIESPTNPLMQITDLRALASLLHERGVLLSVDCTMMTPLLMKPLALGCDVVVHSATKYWGGHSDCMGGLLAVATEKLANKIAFYQNAEGTALAPFDCWLFLRGIKTMAIRLEKAQSNAERIAEWLRRHPRVTTVNYAGLEPLSAQDAKALILAKREALTRARVGRVAALRRTKSGTFVPGSPWPVQEAGEEDGGNGAGAGVARRSEEEEEEVEWHVADPASLHPLPSDDVLEAAARRAAKARAIHVSQASGGGAVMSFTTGNVDTSRRVVDALRIFKITVSFGSCNSLVEMPVTLSHASIAKDKRTLPEDLVRLSVGIEDAEDLLADLKQAFELACNPAVPDVQAVARQRRNSDAVFVFGDAAQGGQGQGSQGSQGQGQDGDSKEKEGAGEQSEAGRTAGGGALGAASGGAGGGDAPAASGSGKGGVIAATNDGEAMAAGREEALVGLTGGGSGQGTPTKIRFAPSAEMVGYGDGVGRKGRAAGAGAGQDGHWEAGLEVGSTWRAAGLLAFGLAAGWMAASLTQKWREGRRSGGPGSSR